MIDLAFCPAAAGPSMPAEMRKLKWACVIASDPLEAEALWRDRLRERMWDVVVEEVNNGTTLLLTSVNFRNATTALNITGKKEQRQEPKNFQRPPTVLLCWQEVMSQVSVFNSERSQGYSDPSALPDQQRLWREAEREWHAISVEYQSAVSNQSHPSANDLIN